MEWRDSSLAAGETGLVTIARRAPSAMSALKFEGGNNVSAPPACLSFVALPLSSSSPSSGQCPGACLESPPASLTSSSFLQDRASASGAFYESSCCDCGLLPPLMQSLLPLPFSSSSLSSFFPAHLPAHDCTTSSSLPTASPACVSSASPSISPSGPRWRRRNSAAGVSSSEKALRLSSLASIASSLPSFSSAEKAFGTKNEGKDSRGISDRDAAGGNLPLVRNLMAGNARFRKEIANLIQQLPLESRSRGIQRQNVGSRAAKRIDSDAFQETTPGNGTGSEKRTKTIKEGKKKAVQTSKHLLAGAIAAMVSRTVVAPLERLKLEYLVRGAKGNVVETLQTIFLNEGVRGFWKGNGVNILRTAPFKSVNFFAFDTYRRQLLKWGDRTEVSNLERLAAGAAAGVTATILCFPLDTMRTLMVAPGGEALGGLIGCFHHLIRTEGFLGLYKGLLPAVVSMAPSGAVFYGVYDILKTAYLSSPQGREMIKARVKRAKERPEETSTQLELGPFRTLLFGALAGACAETITYPLEVVRRAQQMQSAANNLGMIGTFQGLLKKGGVAALYAGILPSTMQVLPSAALSYFMYETMKMAFEIP